MRPSSLLVLMILFGVATAEDDSQTRLPLQRRIVSHDGIMHATVIQYLGFAIQDVVAVPRVDNGVLSIEHIRGSAYEGTITGSLAIDLTTNDIHFSAEVVDWDFGVMLEQVGKRTGLADGTLSGRFDLVLPGGDPDRASGSGQIHIVDGDLMRLPTLADLIAGSPGGARNRDEAHAHFDMVDGRARLREAHVMTRSATLFIHGGFGLRGDLDLVVSPRLHFSFLTIIPGIGDILARNLGSVSKRLGRTAITGTITAPVIEVVPFADTDR